MSVEDEVHELRDKMESLENRVEELEEIVNSKAIKSIGSGIRKFFNEKNPNSHSERATTIGYYLEHEGGLDSFTVNDLKDGYIDCKVSLPANMSSIVASAEDRGWLMRVGESEDHQLWVVTQDGEAAVEEGF